MLSIGGRHQTVSRRSKRAEAGIKVGHESSGKEYLEFAKSPTRPCYKNFSDGKALSNRNQNRGFY